MNSVENLLRIILVSLSFCFFASTSSALVEVKSTKLLSYIEWKNHTRQEIQKKITQLEQKLLDQKDAKKSFDVETVTQLKSEKMRYEASADLSFHEYFLSYLSLQKDLDTKISELAKLLKPEEIKELISSYVTIIKNKKAESDKQGYASDPLEN